jgi:hypothetical protein
MGPGLHSTIFNLPQMMRNKRILIGAISMLDVIQIQALHSDFYRAFSSYLLVGLEEPHTMKIFDVVTGAMLSALGAHMFLFLSSFLLALSMSD